MTGAAAQPVWHPGETDDGFMKRLDEWATLKCSTCGCSQAGHENAEDGNGVLGDVCWGCFYEYEWEHDEAPPLSWKHRHRFKS